MKYMKFGVLGLLMLVLCPAIAGTPGSVGGPLAVDSAVADVTTRLVLAATPEVISRVARVNPDAAAAIHALTVMSAGVVPPETAGHMYTVRKATAESVHDLVARSKGKAAPSASQAVREENLPDGVAVKAVWEVIQRKTAPILVLRTELEDRDGNIVGAFGPEVVVTLERTVSRTGSYWTATGIEGIR